MEEMRELGSLALKLERYRYNITESLAWVIFGMLFGSAIAMFNGITLLVGYYWSIMTTCLMSAGLIGAVIYRMFLRFTPPIEETRKRWRKGWFLFFTPFIVIYILLNFLNLTQLQASLYYSLAWYPSLGIGFLLTGIFAEAKDEMLVTKSLTCAGISILASSMAFVPLSKLVTNYYGVVALGLIATSMMLLIYLGVFLLTFFRASKAVFET